MTRTVGWMICAVAGVMLAAQVKDSRAELALQAAIKKETVDGDLKSAIEQYRKVAQSKDRSVAARALVRMGQCYEKLGDAEARKAYERVVREFGDQKEAVAQARQLLAANTGVGESGIIARQLARVGDRSYGHSVTRDGRYLAFTVGGRGIGVHDLSTDEVKTVARPPVPEARLYNALVSPDGNYIAYQRQESPDVNGLYVMGIDGSNPRRLAGGKDLFPSPWDWSPDGKHLLAGFWSKDKGAQVALVALADGSSRIVASRALDGRIAPDGRTIALVKQLPAGGWEFGDVTLASIEGGREVPLMNGRYSQPLWTPDGKRLLVVSDRNGTHELWSVLVVDGGGHPEFVKTDVGRLVAVTPNGDCYFQSQSMARDLYVAEIDPQKGTLSSRPIQITSSPGVNAGAAWSTDGESLAYYAWRGPRESQKLTVVIRSTKSGEERELALKERLSVPSQMPQWFPDSRSLLVHSYDGKLRRLNVQTAELRPLLEGVTITPYIDGTPHQFYRNYVLLAPDGRSIYYLVRDRETRQTRILRRDLEGGPEAEVCRVRTNGISGFAVSPDGSRLMFLHPDPVPGTGPRGSVWMVPANGGEPKEIYRSTSQWLYDPVWTKDGRHLLVMVNFLPGDISVVPIEGGDPKPLGIGFHMKYFLNIHPDGRQIIFADEQWNNHLWVLKNLFPKPKSAR
ncbi:MAG: PD40 domain-containing protein [Acidobacteria bacterium]|nr:PD40 domain-containing protein [Acidobacteriota bacterium]